MLFFSNSLCTRHAQQIKNGALMQSLLIIHSMILLAIQCLSWEACYWQKYWIKPPEVRHCKEAYIWRLTSLLVATLPIFTLKPFAFSDACKSYPFLALQADTSKKVTVTWLLRCKNYMDVSKQSVRSGNLGLVTFLQTKNAHLHVELIIHIDL